MICENEAVKDVQIAYIGGGSRGWARTFMTDLAMEPRLGGTIRLYDIDTEAARANEIIGNRLSQRKEAAGKWLYRTCMSMEEALTGADFVVISILPGTFDEMAVDVHMPERLGIYQSVGDTAGPGGMMRALRTIPLYVKFAEAIKQYSPDAWVINYTNPMTVCVKTLYRVFPKIKAFGCSHEVFGTQKLLGLALEDIKGIQGAQREDIRVNVVGINHFTWLTAAQYKNMDLFPIYREFALKYRDEGFGEKADENWLNRFFDSREQVKLDLFLKYGAIAAAGDRHLAEFCPGSWYLKDEETAHSWGFKLTPVSWRKEDLKNRLARSERLYKGEEEMTINQTGEEGVQQMRSLLGLRDLVTNVNIPNCGQIPNLPLGAVVETNAHFSADSVRPVFAGPVPQSVYPLVSRVCGIQEMTVEAAMNRDLELAFQAFCMDPNMELGLKDARILYNTMVENTAKYLTMYQ